jgi:hypothetical protein
VQAENARATIGTPKDRGNVMEVSKGENGIGETGWENKGSRIFGKAEAPAGIPAGAELLGSSICGIEGADPD